VAAALQRPDELALIAVFIAVSEHPAPKLVARSPAKQGSRHYGPLACSFERRSHRSSAICSARDCADRMPMVRRAGRPLRRARHACPRHDLGLCSGPCAGLVIGPDCVRASKWRRHFFEGRAIAR
jgi:excinuclease UvrABC nuclease subunit